MRAIGFHHHQETLTKDDTPQLRGMLHQVRHLVRVEETGVAKKAAAKSAAKPSQEAAKTAAAPENEALPAKKLETAKTTVKKAAPAKKQTKPKATESDKEKAE
jgi:hypothetical protein